jgi:hypothetical protein
MQRKDLEFSIAVDTVWRSVVIDVAPCLVLSQHFGAKSRKREHHARESCEIGLGTVIAL